MARTWIGCSGWSYDHWVGVLYPEGLPKARWRDAYTEAFEAVELNASFYRWPGAKQFHRWGAALPDDFKMAIKASRWITHARRLSDPDNAWVLRLHEAWRGLGEHAGPVLLQLHPTTSATTNGSMTSSTDCPMNFRWRWSYVIRAGTSRRCSPCSSSTALPTW